MPKSINTALAMILLPILLGTDATTFLPSSVVQFNLMLSSLRLTMGVLGISAVKAILLFCSWQVPLLPSLKDSAIGTKASLVSDAHPAREKAVIENIKIFRIFFSRSLFDLIVVEPCYEVSV